jgi:cytoskeleton protein RodZ
MEPLGEKLKQARLARKITLEEASRVTKIRPSRIAEIEQEDFSSFASLAYAKGFLLIYGKYLDVDVRPYLEAFEISDRVTVDGYSYLQDSGPTAPPPIVRRQPRKSPAVLPFVVAVAVLVIGLWVIKLFLNLQRITPPRENAPNDLTPALSATPLAGSPPQNQQLVAPRAEPVDGPPASEAGVTPLTTPNAAPRASAAPANAGPTEPEVRRAQPVHPEDVPATPPPND